MKKIFAVLLALSMVFALAACTSGSNEPAAEPEVDIFAKGEGVMTYAEYAAADLDTEVTVETFVQATQSWWDNTITAYTQDNEGAYFLYNMACSEEDAAKLVPGTKIKVTGVKAGQAKLTAPAAGTSISVPVSIVTSKPAATQSKPQEQPVDTTIIDEYEAALGTEYLILEPDDECFETDDEYAEGI